MGTLKARLMRMNNNKIKLFGIDINPLTMQQTVQQVSNWIESNEVNNHYVVTPNVDHVVNLQENTLFQQAYQEASLVVADGRPVVLASKLLDKPLPEVVPGSDLVPALFDYYQQTLQKPLRVFLLGAMPGVAERAAVAIHQQWPHVKVVGCYSPLFGFEKSETASLEICNMVSQHQPDVVVFGVGAPKQEIWSQQYSKHLNSKVILCVGATIDFIAGEKPRAPQWMRKSGLEWLHRVASEPRRLLKRYFIGAFVFPKIVWREWKKHN